MELTPEIRSRLKSVMENNNDTGYTLNKKLGISATTIGNYLNGKITKADNTKLKAMCELWGISMEWLEFGHDMVKCPGEPETIPEEETTESTLKQILLKLSSQDAQFNNLRKDILSLKEHLEEIKKEMTHLKKKKAN